jgi:hypothetical protein
LRGKSGKRPRGEPGHQGQTLAQQATPDVLLTHTPTRCHARGAPLATAPHTSAAADGRGDLLHTAQLRRHDPQAGPHPSGGAPRSVRRDPFNPAVPGSARIHLRS